VPVPEACARPAAYCLVKTNQSQELSFLKHHTQKRYIGIGHRYALVSAVLKQGTGLFCQIDRFTSRARAREATAFIEKCFVH
jgi:hypothetical protein